MRYIIIANGPFLSPDVIADVIANKNNCVVIALDGAIDKLAKLGILPDILIGDLDSVDREAWGIPEQLGSGDIEYFLSKQGIHIIHVSDQTSTDLSKAIMFCDKANQYSNFTLAVPKLNSAAIQIDIVCAEGGRLDHTLGNLGALRKNFRKERPIWLHTQAQSICFLKDMSIEIEKNSDTAKRQVAVIGMPYAEFTSSGLRWNGEASSVDGLDIGPNGYKVFPGHDSISNLLDNRAPNCIINVTGEALVMRPGLYASQLQYA